MRSNTEHGSDLISRQAAIDAVSKGCQEWRGIFGRCEENILALPSAQTERELELDGTESNIEILSELRSMFNCFDEAEEPVYRALSDAICALSAQPERKRGEWIPCSEKYPDMDERVLVYTVAHEYHVWDCMSNRADNYFWEDESGLYHDKYEVDLWLPLPEPWRGEEHGQDD